MFLLVKVSGHLAAMPRFGGPGRATPGSAENRLHPMCRNLRSIGYSKAALYRLTAGTPAMQNASPLEQLENTV